jgi:hypothetical protein
MTAPPPSTSSPDGAALRMAAFVLLSVSATTAQVARGGGVISTHPLLLSIENH